MGELAVLLAVFLNLRIVHKNEKRLSCLGLLSNRSHVRVMLGSPLYLQVITKIFTLKRVNLRCSISEHKRRNTKIKEWVAGGKFGGTPPSANSDKSERLSPSHFQSYRHLSKKSLSLRGRASGAL